MKESIKEFVVPIPCTEFDFEIGTRTEKEKITGKEKEEILSCLKPILDIIKVDYDDIYLYRDDLYYGFFLLTRYFSIGSVAGSVFGMDKCIFQFSLKFMILDKSQRLVDLYSRFDTDNHIEEGGKEFFDLLKEIVGSVIDDKEEELKEFAELLKSSKDSIDRYIDRGGEVTKCVK